MIRKGFVYILECAKGKYYTGSLVDLGKRISEHQIGLGSDFTKGNLPVKLVYYEEYARIDLAFKREKQIQGWSRKKKEALINGNFKELPELSKSKKKREGC